MAHRFEETSQLALSTGSSANTKLAGERLDLASFPSGPAHSCSTCRSEQSTNCGSRSCLIPGASSCKRTSPLALPSLESKPWIRSVRPHPRRVVSGSDDAPSSIPHSC